MLIPGVIGFQTLFFVLVLVLCFWLHHKWRNAVARKEEIKRLVDLVSKESALVEFEAVYEFNYFPKPRQCAVCFCPTTKNCSKCKSVYYCSGKCQIIHWRQGHKDECRPLSTAMCLEQESEFCEKISEPEIHVAGSELLTEVSTKNGKSESPCEVVLCAMSGTTASNEEMQDTKLPPPKSTKTTLAYVNGVSRPSKLNKVKFSYTDEVIDCDSQFPNGKVMSDNVQPTKLGHKKSIRRAASSESLVADSSKCKSSTSLRSLRLDSATDDGENDILLTRGKDVRSLTFNDSNDHSRDACNGLKNSLLRKVQQLKAKQSHNHERIFSYELFVKLYTCDEELRPFGLKNCGNSCYANTVLQCLAFTRPLTSYFAHGLHSKTCQKKEWCFICEFELLIMKAREGDSPLSPIRILSKIQKIGGHLGRGREEDAHEFLRYAVDTMQSVCLKEAGASGLAEETTLVGLTFGGHLQSKITCMRCLDKSYISERIMDLTVEIDGDIATLEEALTQFTADEMLDGQNKYKCSRCKSYAKAKKKLTVVEAPNILTIVLKRFQSGNFGKLNKSVRFPEVLDMAPYMGGKSDKSPQYSLYAVVVHRDRMNDTSMGHYVCYIKTNRGEWFGVNDSIVTRVELERVLLEEAYMLLYARHHPRNGESHGVTPKKRNLEAVPSSLSTSKAKSKLNIPSADTLKPQQKHGKITFQLHDSDDWQFHSLDSPSESSSIFSWSDASSCSTSSTKDSVKSEDSSDFLFGETGPGWYGHCKISADPISPPFYRNIDADLHRRKDSWR